MQEIQQRIIVYGRTTNLAHEEGDTIIKLKDKRKQEEFFWRQKYCINWLQEGEKNTKFFHMSMVKHRHNKIFSL